MIREIRHSVCSLMALFAITVTASAADLPEGIDLGPHVHQKIESDSSGNKKMPEQGWHGFEITNVVQGSAADQSLRVARGMYVVKPGRTAGLPFDQAALDAYNVQERVKFLDGYRSTSGAGYKIARVQDDMFVILGDVPNVPKDPLIPIVPRDPKDCCDRMVIELELLVQAVQQLQVNVSATAQSQASVVAQLTAIAQAIQGQSQGQRQGQSQGQFQRGYYPGGGFYPGGGYYHGGCGCGYFSGGCGYSHGGCATYQPPVVVPYSGVAVSRPSSQLALSSVPEISQIVAAAESTDTSNSHLLVSTTRRKSVSSADVKTATRLYGRAFHLYRTRDYAGALQTLNQALKSSDRDARVWYYKGLTEIALGQETDAADSLGQAVRLEINNPGQHDAINKSLESIQGPLRMRIRSAKLQARPVKEQPVSRPIRRQNKHPQLAQRS